MIIKQRRKSLHEDSTHAMIDVVFLLLIYFMCTMSFGFMELDLDAHMSEGSSAADTNQQQQDIESITIFVVRRGGFESNGFYCKDVHALRKLLQPIRDLVDARVIIDGDPDVAFKYVIAAMNTAVELSFSKISFAGKR